MKQYTVRNVDGLNKFEKDEIVLSNLEETAPNEVRVYKVDASGDILRNERGNAVSYSLNKNRLREVDVQRVDENSLNVLQKRVLKKMFTDKALDAASDYDHDLKAFIKVTCEVKKKLEDIATKLLGKLNRLNDSVDHMNADEFKAVMAEINAITKLIEKEPLATIKQLHEDLWLADKAQEYDAVQDILIDD